jgi:predicted nucleotidyltransferase
MPRVDPPLLAVLTDVCRGLRELRVPFAIIGALVPELLLDARPPRMTRDADVTAVVGSLEDFRRVKTDLAAFGFSATRVPHVLRHHEGGRLDLLPYSESVAPDGYLRLEDGAVLNMAGF